MAQIAAAKPSGQHSNTSELPLWSSPSCGDGCDADTARAASSAPKAREIPKDLDDLLSDLRGAAEEPQQQPSLDQPPQPPQPKPVIDFTVTAKGAAPAAQPRAQQQQSASGGASAAAASSRGGGFSSSSGGVVAAASPLAARSTVDEFDDDDFGGGGFVSAVSPPMPAAAAVPAAAAAAPAVAAPGSSSGKPRAASRAGFDGFDEFGGYSSSSQPSRVRTDLFVLMSRCQLHRVVFSRASTRESPRPPLRPLLPRLRL